MNRIDQLIENYRSHIQMPLRPGLASPQRVWFAVYPAAEERRLINRIDEFEMLTKAAGHPWVRIDLKGNLPGGSPPSMRRSGRSGSEIRTT